MARRLTAACPYQHGPHRNTVGVVRFELTISCFQSRRPYKLSRGQAFLHASTSTQRESNPHIRHGKPVSFRYIMGANVLIKLSKNERSLRRECAVHQPMDLHSRMKKHRVGLEPTFPHYGCGVLAAERPVHFSQWDQRDLNVTRSDSYLSEAGKGARIVIPFGRTS